MLLLMAFPILGTLMDLGWDNLPSGLLDILKDDFNGHSRPRIVVI